MPEDCDVYITVVFVGWALIPRSCWR